MLAMDVMPGAFLQTVRVIVDAHREHARSYRGLLIQRGE
jgi:hypothetical protein